MRVFMCCVCVCVACARCVSICVWCVGGVCTVVCSGKANDQRNREREVFDLLSNFKWVNSQTFKWVRSSGYCGEPLVQVIFTCAYHGKPQANPRLGPGAEVSYSIVINSTLQRLHCLFRKQLINLEVNSACASRVICVTQIE